MPNLKLQLRSNSGFVTGCSCLTVNNRKHGRNLIPKLQQSRKQLNTISGSTTATTICGFDQHNSAFAGHTKLNRVVNLKEFWFQCNALIPIIRRDLCCELVGASSSMPLLGIVVEVCPEAFFWASKCSSFLLGMPSVLQAASQRVDVLDPCRLSPNKQSRAGDG